MTQKDILVFGHSLRREIVADGNVLIDDEHLGVITRVLDAYKNGEILKEQMYEDEFTLNMDVDFSKVARGNVAGIFAGHLHDDIVEYTKSSIPCVFTANFNLAECRLTDI